MRVAVAGKRGMGGFILRGMHVAERMGWDVIELDRERPKVDGLYDAIVLVKYDLGHAALLREHCELFVWDPLDAFTQWGPKMEAVDFWREASLRVPADVLVATSPSCEKAMRVILSKKVWMLPHSADPRVEPMQRDPNGAIVYWGGRQYIESVLAPVAAACKAIEREFIVDESKGPWQQSGPVSLALHLRTYPWDSPVMRTCKPQIKAANAAAAGLPLLATDDPCVTSLCPSVRTITADDCCRPVLLASRIMQAISDAPPNSAPSLAEHCSRLDALLRG